MRFPCRKLQITSFITKVLWVQRALIQRHCRLEQQKTVQRKRQYYSKRTADNLLNTKGTTSCWLLTATVGDGCLSGFDGALTSYM